MSMGWLPELCIVELKSDWSVYKDANSHVVLKLCISCFERFGKWFWKGMDARFFWATRRECKCRKCFRWLQHAGESLVFYWWGQPEINALSEAGEFVKTIFKHVKLFNILNMILCNGCVSLYLSGDQLSGVFDLVGTFAHILPHNLSSSTQQ